MASTVPRSMRKPISLLGLPNVAGSLKGVPSVHDRSIGEPGRPLAARAGVAGPCSRAAR